MYEMSLLLFASAFVNSVDKFIHIFIYIGHEVHNAAQMYLQLGAEINWYFHVRTEYNNLPESKQTA